MTTAFLLSACGSSGGSSNSSNGSSTITHNGLTYKIVTSPITGEQWLDRNLGAKQVCTKSRGLSVLEFDGISYSSENEADDAYVDSQKDCFGDLYQWGRLTDGHEKRDSSTSTTRATDISSSGNSFIKNFSNPFDWVENTTQDGNNVDDDGSKRETQWSKTDGTSICPVGFRVPTIDELKAETISYADTDDESIGKVKVTNMHTAFKNFLKFPASGFRDYDASASLQYQGEGGSVWSTSPTNGSYVETIFFDDSDANEYQYIRAHGFSVRCIKD